MRTTRADWSAQTPWDGITGKPNIIGQPGPPGKDGADGKQGAPGADGSDDWLPLNTIGVATVRQPPGLPFGPTQKVIWQEIFDLKQYGAAGDGSTDDLVAYNRAVADMTAMGGGCIYAPFGSYYLSTAPTPIDVPCSILGDSLARSTFIFGGNGFQGGSNGNAFEVGNLTLLTNGSSSTGIIMSDGSGAGTHGLFNFHDLDLLGLSTGIQIVAAHRRGFITKVRVDPLLVGIDCTALGLIASDLMMVNFGSTSAVGMNLNGDYHQVHGAKFFGGTNRWGRAITVPTGNGVALSNLLVVGTANEAVNLATSGRVRLENLTFGDVQGAQPVVFTPSLHYVNELTGIGSNANSSYDLRKELAASVTWNPDSLRPLESTTVDVTLTGARAGDQVALGTPDATDYLQVSARVVANDTVRVTITNMSLNVVDLPSASYTVRIFN